MPDVRREKPRPADQFPRANFFDHAAVVLAAKRLEHDQTFFNQVKPVRKLEPESDKERMRPDPPLEWFDCRLVHRRHLYKLVLLFEQARILCLVPCRIFSISAAILLRRNCELTGIFCTPHEAHRTSHE